MRIIYGNYLPLGVWSGSAAPAEDAACQEHTVSGAARLHCRDIHIRIVGVELVEDRMSAARFIEQSLQRGGSDTPRLLRDVAGRATPTISALSLEVFAGEIDGAIGAERRRLSAGVRQRVIIGEIALELRTGWRGRLRA